MSGAAGPGGVDFVTPVSTEGAVEVWMLAPMKVSARETRTISHKERVPLRQAERSEWVAEPRHGI
jgi:hypothetical protein